MQPRHLLPRIWLVTDERQGERLVAAAERLPAGGGILFRHYSLPPDQRRRQFEQVRAAAPASATILLAGPPALAAEWSAHGWHGRGSGPGLHSASVHSLREIRQAEADGAALLFLGPVFATRSHPKGVTLGPRRFAQLARSARRPVVALGGMDEGRARALGRAGAYGWAAVDAWLR